MSCPLHDDDPYHDADMRALRRQQLEDDGCFDPFEDDYLDDDFDQGWGEE